MTPSGMRSTPNRTAIVIALLGGLLAFGLRWYYVVHAQVLQPLDDVNVRADAVDYYRYAWNMVHHSTFSNDVPGGADIRANSFRDPGYATLLAIWMKATSNYSGWYGAVLITQALLGGLTVTFLLLAVRRRASIATLSTAAILMAVWPHNVAMTSFVLSENLLSFLCASLLLCLSNASHSPSTGRYVTAGLIAGMAALTNAVMIPFGIAFAMAGQWKRIATRRHALAFAVASLLLPSLWAVRSVNLPTNKTSSQRAAMNLVQGSWPTYHAAYQLAMTGDEDGERTIEAMSSEIGAFQQGIGTGLSTMWARMSKHPLTYLAWYLEKPALLWSWDIRIGQGDIYVYPTRDSPFRSIRLWKAVEAACYLANPLVLILALIGAFEALLRRTAGTVELGMATMAVLVTIVYSVLQSEPRYSVPFRGVEIILACAGATAVSRRLLTRRGNRRREIRESITP
jgi:4-amino-4-deoxy-L-arabinose transferase-like glycosyltransferase